MRAMTKRIVVLGSNSFSGSHFVHKALCEGDNVLAISRSRPLQKHYRPFSLEAKALSCKTLDLNFDIDKIKEEIRLFRPDIVISYAAQGMVGESWKYPLDWYQTNFTAHVDIVEWLYKNFSSCRFVATSTPEVYGDTGSLEVVENTDYRPSTPYAVSKAAFDMHLMNMKNTLGFDVVITRAANVYGSGQLLYRIIPRSILCALSGEKLFLHGGGSSVRSFIHIRDVVDATYKIATRSPTGEIWHISNNERFSIADLVNRVYSEIGADFENGVEIVGERAGKDGFYSLDTTKLKDRLGFQPVVDLESGIREVVNWIRNNYDLLSRDPWSYVHRDNRWRQGD